MSKGKTIKIKELPKHLLIADVSKSLEDYKKRLDLNNSWQRERLFGVIDFLSTVCETLKN
uniref:Uncharacterized protein n=1 Tax=viral metagenome TaxID=1070528 RepID=A0A6M3J3I3_9ZZZZ